MKITVEHEIPEDASECVYPGDFWGKPVCRYHTHRDRTHGRKVPTERRVPKCKLFDTWLPGAYKKCPECIEATKRAKGE